MSPIAQLPTPPSKFTVFMEKFGWPTITLIVGTVLAAVILTIWLGKIQVVNFDWLVLGLTFMLIAITAFFSWYNVRTRYLLHERNQKDIEALQKKYQADLVALGKDNEAFKSTCRDYVHNETKRWNGWAISFSAQADKEHRERTEELKKQCMEAISDAKNTMAINIKNAQSLFSGAVESQRFAVDQYKDQLIATQKQMQALEEWLRKELTPENKE